MYVGLEHGGVIMTIMIIIVIGYSTREQENRSNFFLFYMSSCWFGSETGV